MNYTFDAVLFLISTEQQVAYCVDEVICDPVNYIFQPGSKLNAMHLAGAE